MSTQHTPEPVTYERPPLIKAGDARVRLGLFRPSSPKVDCYVIAAENLHALEQQCDELQKAVNALSHQIALANGAVLLARQQRDAALAGLSRIAKYPLTRADELSAEQMRAIARDYMAKAGSATTVEQVHPLDALGRKCGLWPGCGCSEAEALVDGQCPIPF